MALSNLQKEIGETSAKVDSDSLAALKGDRTLMTLVFQNLLSNAIKYRADGVPLIRIEAKREIDQWIVSVADNGQGFDQKYAEMIFLPLKRLHGPATPGSGIGLATCKRIIDRLLGGRIWAEAAPGAGATFYFTLPDQIIPPVDTAVIEDPKPKSQ